MVLAVLAAAISGFFIFRDIYPVRSPAPLAPVAPAEPELTSNGVKPQTAIQNNELNALKNAALDRKIPAGDATITKELKDLSLQLSREPNYLQGWLQVGILRKYLGDYKGASLAWQYATLLRPNDYIAFSNLGDLYHYYLHDFPKAEKYLRRAIDLKPDYVAGYKNLFDLYTLSYKEKISLAEPVLLEGIKKNPSDNYLKKILDSYRAGNL